jgi:hypothetical protein
MHSFHQSRGRIYFDIFCALTIATACAFAWLQTGASALLAIAGVAALYSLVRATDAGRRSPTVAAELPVSEPSAGEQGELLNFAASAEAAPADEPKAPPKAKRRSRKKQPALEPVADSEAAEPRDMEPVDVVPQPVEALELVEEVEAAEEYHPPIQPLFEPEPLVRQQRAVFGRKAG